jgi:AraC-like DNA-binding protein
MITARSFGAMPEFIAAYFGARSLDRVMARSGLPFSVLENRNLYIPQSLLASFLLNSAREAGDDRFGLAVSPHLTVADYGVWGEYVLSAPTVRTSLHRVRRAIGLHSSDNVSLTSMSPGVMQFRYGFAGRNEDGYDHIAACAVGVICSVLRHYIGKDWRPTKVGFDIEKPRQASIYEDVLDCAVSFGGDGTTVQFETADLALARSKHVQRTITFHDVSRSRLGGTPRTFKQAVWFVVMLQLLEGGPDLDQAAQTLGVGVRGLQRSLASEATTFREITNHAIIHRSKELLSERDLSISQIAVDLGYSTPSHFARAFLKQTGLTPGQFRILITMA